MSNRQELTPSEKMRAALRPESRERKNRTWLAVLAGAVAAFFVIGCCLCGIGLWWFRPVIRESPEQTIEVTKQIADITIPEAFQPHGLIEWNLAFVVQLRGVYYQRYVGDGVITLLEVNTQLPQDDTIRNHIRKTLLEEGPGGTELRIDPSQSHREIFEIEGRPVPFRFDVARSQNDVYHLVEGVFDGNRGQVLLSMRVDDVHWKGEADFAAADRGEKPGPVPIWVREMIQSIGQTPKN